jgi:hypothetical protein
MSTINLPNESIWDNTKPYNQQSPEAMEALEEIRKNGSVTFTKDAAGRVSEYEYIEGNIKVNVIQNYMDATSFRLLNETFTLENI